MRTASRARAPGGAASPSRPLAQAELSTPLGIVWIGATAEGLARVALPPASRLEVEVVPPLAAGQRWLAESLAQLEAYFAGRLRRFTLELDLSAGTLFERRVWRAAARIPYGQVMSYGELAARAGSPLGARAVGRALGRNPIAVVVACHRVVQQDGGLGGFSAGLGLKRKLLAHEGYLLDMA